MDEKVAREIFRRMYPLLRECEAVAWDIKSQLPEAEWREYRGLIGKVAGSILNVYQPLTQLYPETRRDMDAGGKSPAASGRRLKLALVHYAYVPVIGGVERVMREQVELLEEHGHEVTVFCQKGGESDGRVVLLPLEENEDAIREVLAGGLQGMDAVIVHNVMTMPFHSALRAALSRLAEQMETTRWIAWVHDVAACNPDLAPVPGWCQEAHPAFEYVAVSELRRRQWKEVSGCESRVIPNGVDPAAVMGLPPLLGSFAKEHSLMDGRTLLLHPTRVLRRKNIEMSLAVTAELNRFGHRAALLVTGAHDPHNRASAQYGEWLDELRQRMEKGQAFFLSEFMRVDDGVVRGLYSMADGLIFPSRQEGFGLPVLEATLHRLPVFCSKIEPVNELPGACGGFFGLNEEPAEVARRIADYLEQDEVWRQRRRVLAEYSWESIYQKHLRALLEAAIA